MSVEHKLADGEVGLRWRLTHVYCVQCRPPTRTCARCPVDAVDDIARHSRHSRAHTQTSFFVPCAVVPSQFIVARCPQSPRRIGGEVKNVTSAGRSRSLGEGRDKSPLVPPPLEA